MESSAFDATHESRVKHLQTINQESSICREGRGVDLKCGKIIPNFWSPAPSIDSTHCPLETLTLDFTSFKSLFIPHLIQDALDLTSSSSNVQLTQLYSFACLSKWKDPASVQLSHFSKLHEGLPLANSSFKNNGIFHSLLMKQLVHNFYADYVGCFSSTFYVKALFHWWWGEWQIQLWLIRTWADHIICYLWTEQFSFEKQEKSIGYSKEYSMGNLIPGVRVLA